MAASPPGALHRLAGRLRRQARQLLGELPRLLPRARCRLCSLPCHAALCSACQCAYGWAPAWRCECCALALPAPAARCGACAMRAPAFSATLAWADYAPPLDRLVASIKFGDDPALARWLGARLGQRLREAWPGLLLAPPLVVPVPLSAQRLRQRGYNQAWELARGLARELGWRADAGLLERVREAPRQSSLPLARRATNLRGAFVARRLPHGSRVLLVDDVMTSGHTAEHAARALLHAGAAEVVVAVLLRTPARGELLRSRLPGAGTLPEPLDPPCSASSSSTPKSRPIPAT